jgi:hypothetical protein
LHPDFGLFVLSPLKKGFSIACVLLVVGGGLRFQMLLSDHYFLWEEMQQSED